MSDDKQAMDELVADVRRAIERSLVEAQLLRDGLRKEDDAEGFGLEAVSDPDQLARLLLLKRVLQKALADLP